MIVALPGFFAWTIPKADTDTVDESEDSHLKSLTVFAQPTSQGSMSIETNIKNKLVTSDWRRWKRLPTSYSL